MSSSYAFWNRPIFSRTSRSVTSIVSLFCVYWICSIRKIRANETSLRPYFIVSMESFWVCVPLCASKLTTFSTGECRKFNLIERVDCRNASGHSFVSINRTSISTPFLRYQIPEQINSFSLIPQIYLRNGTS